MILVSEIIKVHFTPEKGVEYKAGLKQWDRGKKLEITGLEVTENVQVHFSLTDSVGTAKCYDATVYEGKICVDIPQFILEKEGTRGYSYYAYAWIYIATEELGETIREIVFNIDCRAKPEDYISDPDDIKTWEELEKRIEELEKNGVSDDVLKSAIEEYFEKNNISANVYMRSHEGYIQYSSDNETWNNIVALADLKGQDGQDGADGKSAYKYAQDGGYTGTEEEFAQKLATEWATKKELTEISEQKVELPKNEDGNTQNGEIGQFAVSNGKGGITWTTLESGDEVSY